MTKITTKTTIIFILQFSNAIWFLTALELFFIQYDSSCILSVFRTKTQIFCPRSSNFWRSYQIILLTYSVYFISSATLSTCSGTLQSQIWVLSTAPNWIISYILALAIFYELNKLVNIFLIVSRKLNAILYEQLRSHMTKNTHYALST